MSTFPEPLPRPNPFKCCAEKHLWRNGLALAIYQKVGTITNAGERLWKVDTSQMADFFGANKTYVRRMFALLHHSGFLPTVDAGRRFKKVHATKFRRWISHDEWATTRTGQCAVIENPMPWSGDTDPLAGQICAALDWKMRMYESLLKHARSTGASDREILAALSTNWQDAKRRRAEGNFTGTGVKKVFFDTVKVLREERTGVESATCR